MNKEILRLALPNIISNITVPLLGMVDVAIAGHLDSALYIGAIALGTTIFNMIYWNFTFLRMSTSGLTAQGFGAKNHTKITNTLFRSLILAVLLGTCIVLLQKPFFSLASLFTHSSSQMVEYVKMYYFIVVWSAPAVLSMYVFNGWFIGMQNARIPMIVAILNNILNILLSIGFVFGLHMQIEGIALSTLLSQWIALIIAIVLGNHYYGKLIRKNIHKKQIFQLSSFKVFFRLNSDIFIRTFLLAAVTAFFTFASSSMGDTTLAVNSLLLQFFLLFSYFMDGFAYAGEALTGKYIGARMDTKIVRLIRRLFVWGISIAITASIIYLLLTQNLLQILTDKKEVIEYAHNFSMWTILIPLAGFATFIWDGVYVGATASALMRNSMIVAASVFFVIYYLTVSTLGNNGLWLSFILYLTFRGLMQTVLYFKHKEKFISP